jgi:hypothetical protein
MIELRRRVMPRPEHTHLIGADIGTLAGSATYRATGP